VILVCSSKIGAPTPVGKVRPVLTVIPGAAGGADDPCGGGSLIDAIVRDGARRMLAEALQAEVDGYIARFAGERDENGRRLVVRNGSHRTREVLTSAGAVEMTAPRVNDRRTDPDTGERLRQRAARRRGPAACPRPGRHRHQVRVLHAHKVIWRGPYIKGPDGAPLLTGGKALAIR
jgi:hypothetical protein